ncbi:hypothetical protein GGS26DRAFT_557704 [Hypomontagnella submonticulosa]|nr:hypothetical protein GGS26DRAFT_557704 [Hypomontagnella submonticulosa]
MAGWKDLPAELRLLVYHHLDQTGVRRPRQEDIRHRHYMSAYAAVSHEWQGFFEERTFKQLVIRGSDLGELNNIVTGSRRRWLRTLWMRVELPRYTCESCSTEESEEEVRINNSISTADIWRLFEILGTWKERNHIPFTLMLSVYSPSDNEHHFRNHGFDDDLSAFNMAPMMPRHDPPHEWHYGLQFAPELGPRLRAFGEPLSLELTQVSVVPAPRLPSLDFVTEFVLPRQFYRMIPNVDLIFRSLPNLQGFRFEHWRQVSPTSAATAMFRLREVIRALPPSLRRVSIFEDSNGALNPRRIYEAAVNDAISGHLLRDASHQLIEVNASFIIDAKHFFKSFELDHGLEEAPWPHLEVLTLTSSYLIRSRSRGKNNMLVAAAKAAMLMPKLRLLQIWFARLRQMHVFRYVKTTSGPLIEWVQTEGSAHRLSGKVIQAWERYAYMSSQEPLCVEETDILPEQIKGHACALRYLHRVDSILVESSALQLSWESENLEYVRQNL